MLQSIINEITKLETKMKEENELAFRYTRDRRFMNSGALFVNFVDFGKENYGWQRQFEIGDKLAKPETMASIIQLRSLYEVGNLIDRSEDLDERAVEMIDFEEFAKPFARTTRVLHNNCGFDIVSNTKRRFEKMYEENLSLQTEMEFA